MNMAFKDYKGYHVAVNEYGTFLASSTDKPDDTFLSSDTIAGVHLLIDELVKAEFAMKPMAAIHDDKTGRITSVDVDEKAFWWTADGGRREKVRTTYDKFYQPTEANKKIVKAIEEQTDIIRKADAERRRLQELYTDEITFESLRHKANHD